MNSRKKHNHIGRRWGGITLGLVLLGGTGFTPAESPTPAPTPVPADSAARILTAESRIQVAGGSTVRSWECGTGTFAGEIRLAPGLAAFQVADLGQAVQGVDLRIPVATLDCDNGTMNNHMWNALKSRDHTEIRFQLDRYTVTPEGTSGSAELRGNLTIAGTTHPHTLTVEVSEMEGGQLRVRGTSEFPMTEFGVQPPRLMLGTLRVHDPVTVTFDLVLAASR